MNQELFDKLYRQSGTPLALLMIAVNGFHYRIWGVEVNARVIFLARTVTVLWGLACAALYLFFYQLVRKYYDGEKKRKSMGLILADAAVSLFWLVLGIAWTL